MRLAIPGFFAIASAGGAEVRGGGLDSGSAVVGGGFRGGRELGRDEGHDLGGGGVELLRRGGVVGEGAEEFAPSGAPR